MWCNSIEPYSLTINSTLDGGALGEVVPLLGVPTVMFYSKILVSWCIRYRQILSFGTYILISTRSQTNAPMYLFPSCVIIMKIPLGGWRVDSSSFSISYHFDISIITNTCLGSQRPRWHSLIGSDHRVDIDDRVMTTNTPHSELHTDIATCSCQNGAAWGISTWSSMFYLL